MYFTPKLAIFLLSPDETRVQLSQKAMTKLEKKFQRLPGLEKWFVEIPVNVGI